MKNFLILVFTLFMAAATHAQNGKIVGVVSDENGETMPGVSVYVDGITQGKSTDIDGKFIFPLPAGTYNLSFKFVSYKTKKMAGVVVKADQITDITLSMEPQDDSVLTTVDVVVRLKSSEDPGMDLARKKSPNFQDGVTQATLRKSPATTASDAIRRVTGASIQDGKFAVIRGMGDRYNAAYINGAPLPSSESDRRAIAFDIFPSNMLDNITIVKTATPNVPGEFAGGVININTKSIPDETSQSVTIGGGYNSNTTFKDFSTYQGGKTDWLGMDDGTRALPAELPNTEQLRDAKTAERGEYAKLFASDWKINSAKARPNLTAQYTLGLTDSLFGNVAGLVFALNYANNNSMSDIYRQEYEEPTTSSVIKTDSLHDQSYSNNVLGSTLLNLAYKIGDKHIIKFNNIYSINSEDRVTIRNGARLYDQDEKQWEKGSVRWFTQNNMYSGQLSGSHMIKKIRFEWNGGYSDVVRDIPNMRRIIYQKTSAREDDTLAKYGAVIDPNNSRAGGIMFFSNLTEKIYSGKYDLTIPFEFKKAKGFKFDLVGGGLHQYRDRTFSARNIGYDKYRVGSSIRFNSNLLLLDESEIFSDPYIGVLEDSIAPYKGGFGIKETTKESDSYTAHARLNAYYGMLDLKFGTMFRVIGGARYENYSQYLETKENGKPLITDTTVNDLLPSVNAVFNLENAKRGSSFVLRAAYYRTVSRPEFRELAVFSFYDFITDFEMYGNEKLQRALIDNYDFRAEFYPNPGQIIAGSVFYKNITNPTELASRPDVIRTLYYTNVPKATNIGAELEYRIKLSLFTKTQKDTLPFVSNTSFFANFAYVKSEVDVKEVLGATATVRPLQGQSPYLVNAGITTYIPFLKINTTVSYNVYGDRLYIVGSVLEPDYWEKSRQVIDCQLSREFGKHWVIKLNIRDLLAQKQILYQDLDGDGKFNEILQAQKQRLYDGMNKVSGGYYYGKADNTMVSTQWGRVFSLQVTYNF